MANPIKKNVVVEDTSDRKLKSSGSSASNRTAPDFFERLGNRAVFVAAAIIILIAFVVFKDYLLFEKAYLFKDIGSDSIQGLYPLNCMNADYLHKYGLPKWSFNCGMGQNIFAGFFWDPFNLFFYIAGKTHIVYGMAYKEVIKILLTGFFFYKYLKLLGYSNYTSLTGCLLLSFCGFIIVGSTWNIFSNEAFEFALLLFSFELLFTKQKWHLFPLPIFLICMSMPFNLYIYGIFIGCYAMLRLFQSDSFTLKNALLILSKMLGLGAIAILISSPFFIENVFQLLESPRGSGSTSVMHDLSSAPMFAVADRVQLGTSVMRFFSNDILGKGNEKFIGWKNFLEAPLFYCGLPCLILMPQAFAFLKKRTRVAFIVFISIWIVPIVFPYFRHAFWLFAGDYYRGYSLFVAFLFLYYSLIALESIIQKRRINLILLLATMTIWICLLYYPFFPDDNSPDRQISIFVTTMLVAYGIILFFISRQGSSRYLKYILLSMVILELVYSSNITVNERDALTSGELATKTGYNDYSVDAINYLKHNDHSFYRIDKTYGSSPAYYPSLNDGMVQNYNGTSSYSSFNQQYYIKYLTLMGVIKKGDDYEAHWVRGLINLPIIESQNSVKYILTKKSLDPVYNLVCDSIASFGDVKVYRHRYVAPFGFAYNSFIKESSFEGLSAVQKNFVSLTACVVADKDLNAARELKEFQLKDTMPPNAMTYDIYKQNVIDLSKDSMTITKFDDNSFAGSTDFNEDKMIYMSVPYDNGWKLKIDGQQSNKILLNGGMIGTLIKKGKHNVELVYDLRFFTLGLYLCIFGILLYIGLHFFTKKYKTEPRSSATSPDLSYKHSQN